MKNLIDKNEIHRLKKALKDKNYKKLEDWAYGIQLQIEDELNKQYRKKLEERIEIYTLVLTYILHFNEGTKFGQKRLTSFINDLHETVYMIYRKELNFMDLIKQLKQDNIDFKF